MKLTKRIVDAAQYEGEGNAKASGGEDQRRIDAYVLPKWASLKARAIPRPDVETLHRTIGKSAPYEANRVLALLSKVFELARRWGFVPEGQANPARDIDRFTEAKRDRWVTPDELPRLAQAINVDKPWNRVRAAAGVEDVRLHDLRRTVGSWLAQSGNSLDLNRTRGASHHDRRR